MSDAPGADILRVPKYPPLKYGKKKTVNFVPGPKYRKKRVKFNHLI